MPEKVSCIQTIILQNILAMFPFSDHWFWNHSSGKTIGMSVRVWRGKYSLAYWTISGALTLSNTNIKSMLINLVTVTLNDLDGLLDTYHSVRKL